MEVFRTNWIYLSCLLFTSFQELNGERVTACHDMRGHVVQIGEVYHPFRDQPCVSCVCRLQYREPGDVAGCMTVQCAAPSCDNYELIEGECCGFKCLDEDVDVPLPITTNKTCSDFRGHRVQLGELYKPDRQEPCMDCRCTEQERQPGDYMGCVAVVCRQPTCVNFVAVDGQCCEYTCLDDGNNLDNRPPPIPEVEIPPPRLGGASGVERTLQRQLGECCSAGRRWYEENREQCPLYTGSFTTGTVDEKRRCQTILDICCIQEREKRDCDRGVSSARIQGTCDGFHRQVDREDATECCSCCLLGISASDMGVSCDVLGQNFSSRCQRSFAECCSGSPGTSTTTTTTPAIPTTTTTINPDDNLRLCEQFQGKLCAHLCIDIPSSYRCACRDGFELHSDGRTCRQQIEEDRCNENNPCDHLCFDTGAAVNCKCFDGYRLTSDGFTCQDVNECEESTHNCLSPQACANLDGSFTCVGPVGDNPTLPRESCDAGYAFNEVTQLCEDIDECIINRSTCESSERCVNSLGSYTCVPLSHGDDHDSAPDNGPSCGKGFFFNTDTNGCEDMDECELGTHRCSGPNQKCRNTVGSFVCSCGTGFTYNRRTGECEDLNECAVNYDTCMFGQTCVNTVGSYMCRRTMSCGTGYTLEESTQECLDIDECKLNTHDCSPTKECRNIPGSFRCVGKRCPQGYRLNVVTGSCDQVSCQRGFKPNPLGDCVDINECRERPSACRPNQECRNTVGSFRCRDRLQCGPGMELNEAGTRCIDINECQRGLDDCTGEGMVCANRRGSYVCQCPPGYQKNDRARRCDDIDECNSQFGGQVCDLNARCENTQGSFRCICNDGFENEGGYCRDINECDRAGMCQHMCQNIGGSFICSCFEGYKLAADQRTCEDIDECSEYAQRGGQLCLGTCRNTVGSYQCACPDGYRMDSDDRTCQDIDECAEGSSSCVGADDHCINTRGGYKCETVTCPRGFLKAPSLSSRNNAIRCQRQTFVCSQGDTECLYAPLSLSYNFIAFPEKIRIPADLFTMRGPQSPHRRLDFELTLESAVDPLTGVSRVDRNYFSLLNTADHVALIRLMREIEGPQDIELKLSMNIHSREFREDNEEIFFGTAIAVIKIYVTKDFY